VIPASDDLRLTTHTASTATAVLAHTVLEGVRVKLSDGLTPVTHSAERLAFRQLFVAPLSGP
jgi:hypothetical protein